MKKLVLAAALISPSAAFADFIGVHGGISQWKSEFSGEIAGIQKYNERQSYGWGVPSFEERGFDGESNLFGYIAFEHPIPMLPNLRIDYTSAKEKGTSPEDINTRRYDTNIPGVDPVNIAQKIHTNLTIEALDATLYYELLDNWVSFDLGLNIRRLSGIFTESSFAEPAPALIVTGNDCGDFLETPDGFCVLPPQTDDTDFSFVAPLLYAQLRFDLPLSGAYAETTAKGIAFDGNKIVDGQIEIGYMIDLVAAEIGLGMGYRYSSMEAEDLEGVYSDAKLEGYYAGLKFHF